jgi:hypothetical protein
VELRVTNTDGSIAAQYMIEAEDDVPARREKLLQWLRTFLRTFPRQDPALTRAQIGDWEELARHIEKGGDITDDMRKFIADVLRGRKRAVTHRPPKERVDERNKTIALVVRQLEESGLGATAAKQLAAEKFNLDFRSVQRVATKWKSFVEPVAIVEKHFLHVTDGLDEAAARARILASNGISEDEVRRLILLGRRRQGQ